MAKKLFVGGLSYDTTEESLKTAFSEAGTVESVAIITDRMTGHSRGFGFIEMLNDEEAAKAIELFDDKEFEGRTLKVSEARPRNDKPFQQDRDKGFGSERSFDV